MKGSWVHIDPRFPVGWEDEHTLRIGFERAKARVHAPSAATQRFIGSLTRGGVPARELETRARATGLNADDAEALLAALRPVLVSEADLPDERPPVPLLTVVDDDGREVAGLRDLLAANGLMNLEDERRPDVIVLVERYLQPLGRARRWLHEAVPQLLLRFSDDAVRIGPIVRPDGSPCHACLSLALVEHDPAYPALAAQLHAHTAPTESPMLVSFAASHAAALLQRWRQGDPEVHRTRIVLHAGSNMPYAAPTVERVAPSADCACQLLPSAAAPLTWSPPGNVPRPAVGLAQTHL